MTVELRHIRYAIEAAERGSFRAAARALGIQQSAVSRRIRDLEDEIGVSLFIRDHAGIHLTGAGARFLVHARQSIAHLKYAATDAGCLGRGEIGVVRVGIFSSLAGGFLADLLRAYGEQNSGVRADVIEGAPAAHIAAIQHFQIDVAFLTGAPEAEGCDSEKLWTERVFVALPREDRLASCSEIHWEDLRGRRFIVSESDAGPEMHNYLAKHLADPRNNPDVERHTVARDNLMHLVAIGQGLTLTSEATIAVRFPGVVFRPLSGEVLSFAAVWSRRNDNPPFRRLLALARRMVRLRPAHGTASAGCYS